eukprot:363889-Chlamydomonas_euryale.AAC.5
MRGCAQNLRRAGRGLLWNSAAKTHRHARNVLLDELAACVARGVAPRGDRLVVKHAVAAWEHRSGWTLLV